MYNIPYTGIQIVSCMQFVLEMDEIYDEILSVSLNASDDIPYLGIISGNIASLCFGNCCRMYKIVEKNHSQYAVHKLSVLPCKSKLKISCPAVSLDDLVYTVLGKKRIISWNLVDQSSNDSSPVHTPAKVLDSSQKNIFSLIRLKESLLIVYSSGNFSFLSDPEATVNPLNSEVDVEILQLRTCEILNDENLTAMYFAIVYKASVSAKSIGEKNTRLAILRIDDFANLKDLKVLNSCYLKGEIAEVCLPKTVQSKTQKALNVAIGYQNGHSECYDVITGSKSGNLPFIVRSCPSHHYYICECEGRTFLWYESINHVLKECNLSEAVVESCPNFSILVQPMKDKVVVFSHDAISKRGCYLSDLLKPLSSEVVETENSEVVEKNEDKENLHSILEVLEGKVSLSSLEKNCSCDDKSLIRMLRNLENHDVLKLFRQCSRTYISPSMPLGLRNFVLRMCELILSANHDLLISHLTVEANSSRANQRATNIANNQDEESFRKEFVALCVKVNSECRRFDGLTDLLKTYDNLRELQNKSAKSVADQNVYVTYIEL